MSYDRDDAHGQYKYRTTRVIRFSIDEGEDHGQIAPVKVPEKADEDDAYPDIIIPLPSSTASVQAGFPEHNHRNTNFILDSGANMHATPSSGLFSTVHIDDSGTGLLHHARNGSDLHIAAIGTISCGKFHLPDVRYVPDLGSAGSSTTTVVVSVQQLAGSGYLIMFGGGCCYVKGRSDGSLVGRGHMHDDDGLYHLEYLRIPDVACLL